MPALVNSGVFMTAPHGKGYGELETASTGPVGAEDRWRTTLDTHKDASCRPEPLIGSFYGGRKGWAAISADGGSALHAGRRRARAGGRWPNLRALRRRMDALAGGRRDASHAAWPLPIRQSRSSMHGRIRQLLDGRLYLRFHESSSATTCAAAGDFFNEQANGDRPSCSQDIRASPAATLATSAWAGTRARLAPSIHRRRKSLP